MAGPRPSRYFDRSPEPEAERCAWSGCTEAGVHRAPLSRAQLREYQYFCKDHIRDFNRAWNYFEGWQQDEIEAYQQADLSWHRRTWKPGDREATSGSWRDAIFSERIDDLFGVAQDDDGTGGTKSRKAAPEDSDAAEDRRALATLGLGRTATRDDVKRRFKDEVKRCHPDVNGGDRKAEDRLRDVIWAYRRLTRRETA